MLRRCAVASCLWERPGAKSNRRAKTTQDGSIWPPIWPRLPKMASNMASKSPSSSSSSFSAPLLLLPASPLLLACPFSHSSPPLLPLLRQPPTSPQALSRPLLIRFLSRLLHLPLSPRHHSLFHRSAHQGSALARIKSNNECERPARFDSRAFGRSRSGTLTTDRQTDRQTEAMRQPMARRFGKAKRTRRTRARRLYHKFQAGHSWASAWFHSPFEYWTGSKKSPVHQLPDGCRGKASP